MPRSAVVFLITLLCFLVPLAVTPFTTEALEMGKQTILVGLVGLAVLVGLGAMLFRGTLEVRGGGWLYGVLGAVALVTFFSSLSSIAGGESWFGYGGQEYSSFVTTAAGTALVCLLLSYDDAQLVRWSVRAMLGAGVLVALLGILSLFGVHLLPFAFTHVPGFSTIGNVNAFASWVACVAVLSLGTAMLQSADTRREMRVAAWSTAVFLNLSTTFLLLAIDYWTLWVSFAVGLGALLAVSAMHAQARRLLVLPGVLLLLSIGLLFIQTPMKVRIPLVVSPSIQTSLDIARQTLSENAVRVVFGSGPSSYDLDYARYKPQSVNQSAFWTVRFDRAQMHALTLLTTLGVVGALVWLMLCFMIFAMGVKGVSRHGSKDALLPAVFAAWLTVLAVHVLAASNMSLTVLFWTLSGLVLAAAAGQRTVGFAHTPRVRLLAFGASGLVFVVLVFSFIALFGRVTGEMYFAQAARFNVAGASVDEVVRRLELAVRRDGGNAVYQRNLATAYLAKFGTLYELTPSVAAASASEREVMVSAAAAAQAAALRATELGKNDARNWATAGLVLRQLMPFSTDAAQYAPALYERAVALEPRNPVYPTELGQVYLMRVEQARAFLEAGDVDPETVAALREYETHNLQLAAEAFEHAIALKPDYAPAHYYMAATLERQGKLAEAADRLLALTQARPRDVGLGFQLGIIYVKLDRTEAAEAEFERILGLAPNYSNAMWYLAALRSQAGDIEGALTLLRRIQELNPDHTVVAESIRSLEAGLATPEVPEPLVENGDEGVVDATGVNAEGAL